MDTQQYFCCRFILLFKQISIIGSIISSVTRLKKLHFSYYIFISRYCLVPTLIKKSNSSHNGITCFLGHTSFLRFPYNWYFRNPSLQIFQQGRNNLATFRLGLQPKLKVSSDKGHHGIRRSDCNTSKLVMLLLPPCMHLSFQPPSEYVPHSLPTYYNA